MRRFIGGGACPDAGGTQGESALCSFLWLEPAHPDVAYAGDEYQRSDDQYNAFFAGLSGILFCGHRLLQFR